MTSLLGSAAIVGLVAGCWGNIKALGWRLFNLLVVNVRVDGDAVDGLLILVNQEMYRSPYGERYFSCVGRYVNPLRKYTLVAFERFNSAESVLFWKGWRPLFIQQQKKDASPPTASPLTLSFLRGTFDIDNLIIRSVDRYNQLCSDAFQETAKRERRFFIQSYVGSGKKLGGVSANVLTSAKCAHNTVVWDAGSRFLKWQASDLHIQKLDDGEEVDTLAFPPEINKLVEEMKRWKNSEAWYRDHNIPWRHGWLLYGSPGNGKTSLIRALGLDCDMPILSFDLASMCNSEFMEAWKSALKFSPCVVLFEDLDGVFDGRVNVAGENGGGLTFDCFLNAIGGVDNANGVFVVVTTNKVETIDEALGAPTYNGSGTTRPGRLYRAIELNNPDDECRLKIASRILAEYPEEIDGIVYEGIDESASQFTDRCVQRALERYWSEEKCMSQKNSETPYSTSALSEEEAFSLVVASETPCLG